MEEGIREEARNALCSCNAVSTATGFPFCVTVDLPEGHTQFLMSRCGACGKMLAFPEENALLFIRVGYYPRVIDFYNEYLYRSPLQILWDNRMFIGFILFFVAVAYLLF